MFTRRRPRSSPPVPLVLLLGASLLLALASPAPPAAAKCCVWKVSSGERTLYLAGSVHALRESDYPLPAAYEQAFAASQELVFETEPGANILAGLDRVALLPRGSTLKEHVDPRTYAYLRRVLARARNVSDAEKKIERLRPWALAWRLESPNPPAGLASARGVDTYLATKALRAGKSMSGLVNAGEHVAVFGGMSDADGELWLLVQFVRLDTASAEFSHVVAAWRRGDTAEIDAATRREYRDSPSLYRRLLTDRNRRWLPKLEGYLQRGGHTRMVVAGAAHMSGDEGLPALLRARGFQVEQL